MFFPARSEHRVFAYAPTNADDLKSQSAGNYTYNAIGQLTQSNENGAVIQYTYNAAGLVTEIKKNNLPLLRLYYNDRGQRIKKESYTLSGGTSSLTKTEYYVRDVAGSVMAVYQGSTAGEHPVYGSGRLGVYYRSAGQAYYQLTDHLGNVRAVVARGGSSLQTQSATDYYPGGMPMPGKNMVGDYRYGYQGEFAETDPETGKVAFELRLYDPRINRWLSPDPYGQFDSPYLAMGNNWISMVDPDGGSCYDSQGNQIPCPDGYGGFEGPTVDNITFGENLVISNVDGINMYNALNEVVITAPAKNNEVTVLNPNDWISQFTQPKPNVACKRTCDLIAGNAPLNLAIQVAREKGNQINPTADFNRGVEIINEYLNNGDPITVGVHHTFGTTYNSDNTTDHFIVIMGRGLDNGQVYYRFYEVATRHQNMGTHAQNRLYLNGQEASGRTQYRSRSGVQRHYTLTQVRPRN